MLLGIDIDNCLPFRDHINNFCRKAANQINALKRLSSFREDSQIDISMHNVKWMLS